MFPAPWQGTVIELHPCAFAVISEVIVTPASSCRHVNRRHPRCALVNQPCFVAARRMRSRPSGVRAPVLLPPCKRKANSLHDSRSGVSFFLFFLFFLDNRSRCTIIRAVWKCRCPGTPARSFVVDA